MRLPADLHGWWISSEQESFVTLRSHLLESPFSLNFSELSPWVFARTWTTAHNYPNDTNLLLKQHTSYQNNPVTSSKCPGKAAHSGTKIAKYKATKSNKNTLTEEKYCHKCLGAWVMLRASWSYSCSQWVIHHQTPVETVWKSQQWVSSAQCDTETVVDPSSPAWLYSVNTWHELHGTLSLSLAGEGEKGKSWPVILFKKKLY